MATALDNLQASLEKHGFVRLGSRADCHDCDSPDELEIYNDWEISLFIPNGGILAVNLIHVPTGAWWGRPTTEDFGYYDDEGIQAFAKKVVDSLEQEQADANIHS